MCILTYENHVVALSSAGEECGLVCRGLRAGGGTLCVCVYLAWGLPHHCHQIDSYCASLTYFLYVVLYFSCNVAPFLWF